MARADWRGAIRGEEAVRVGSVAMGRGEGRVREFWSVGECKVRGEGCPRGRQERSTMIPSVSRLLSKVMSGFVAGNMVPFSIVYGP